MKNKSKILGISKNHLFSFTITVLIVSFLIYFYNNKTLSILTCQIAFLFTLFLIILDNTIGFD